MPLLDLGRDIFEHHLLQYLSIHDALQLRQTCKEVRNFLDEPSPLWNALIRQELKITSAAIKDPLKYAMGYSQIQAVHVPFWVTWLIHSQSVTTLGFADFEQELHTYDETVQVPRHSRRKSDSTDTSGNKPASPHTNVHHYTPSWPFGDQPVKDVAVNRAVMAGLTPKGEVLLVPREEQPHNRGQILQRRTLRADEGRRFDKLAATALLIAALDDAGKLYIWHCDRLELQPHPTMTTGGPILGVQFIPQSFRLVYHDRTSVFIALLCDPYNVLHLPPLPAGAGEIVDFAICGMYCVLILTSHGLLYAQQFLRPLTIDGSSDDQPAFSEPLPIQPHLSQRLQYSAQPDGPQHAGLPRDMHFVKVVSSPNEMNNIFWAITDKGQVVQGELDPDADEFCPAQDLEIIQGLADVVNITPWLRVDYHGFLAHTIDGKVFGVTRDLKVTALHTPAIARIVDTFSGGVLLIFPIY